VEGERVKRDRKMTISQWRQESGECPNSPFGTLGSSQLEVNLIRIGLLAFMRSSGFL
jgi:hypothetical protein